jgi:hypothetical protein
MIGLVTYAIWTMLHPSILYAADTRDYGTKRVPRQNCPQVAAGRGAITTAQAKLLASCYGERKRNNYSMQFIDISNVRVLKARAANGVDIQQFGKKLDIQKPVYDITGNVVFYNCYYIIPGTGLIAHKAGQNCTVYKIPEAIGTCVTTIFGKWDCVIDTYALTKEQLPPPAS